MHQATSARLRSPVLVIGLLLACRSSPPTRAQAIPAPARKTCDRPNQAVAEYQTAIRSAPPAVLAMLRAFPKGADLHNHLSGSVMPEDYAVMGALDQVCYGKDRDKPDFLTIRPRTPEGACATDDQPLSSASPMDQLVRSLSMKDFAYPTIQAGHDHFFATFSRFDTVSGSRSDRGRMLARMLAQAEADSVSYVETIVSFQGDAVTQIAKSLRSKFPQRADFSDPAKWDGMVDLIAADVATAVNGARDDISFYLGVMRDTLGCASAPGNPGCAVVVRFHAGVNRNAALDGEPDFAKTFTQTMLAFSLAEQDKHVVGVNMVSGEDLPVAMAAFPVQMKHIAYFHARHPQVKIALHGGELTPCFVGQDNPALLSHLTESIAAGASRLGHGVSFAYLAPEQKQQVANLMRKEQVLVEVPLASNAQILGVAGAEHPFPQYFRDFKVAIALATDDEGVSYTDLTSAWVYAYLQYHLSYQEAVRLVRSSLQHSFLPGSSLWQGEMGGALTPACQTVQFDATVAPDSACAAFLKTHAKAQLQWDLEVRLARFRKTFGVEEWR